MAVSPHAAGGPSPLAHPGEGRTAPQQKDSLCGPFQAARVLRDAGVVEWDGAPVTQDLLALRAGTLLPDDPAGSVPPGAQSKRDYEHELPLAPPEQAGTAAGALAEAIEEAAGGALRCVPVRGAWSGAAVERLVESARELPGGARLIANLRTGRLWGSRPPLEALLAHLDGDDVEPPAADWDVGHFVELRSLVRGARRALVLVRDSYPSLGWAAHHLQPPEAVAAALERGDGREGGVLVVIGAGAAGEAEGLARRLGLEIGIWDNGTRR